MSCHLIVLIRLRSTGHGYPRKSHGCHYFWELSTSRKIEARKPHQGSVSLFDFSLGACRAEPWPAELAGCENLCKLYGYGSCKGNPTPQQKAGYKGSVISIFWHLHLFGALGSGIRQILTLSPFQKELDRSSSTLPPACDLRASQSCSENHLCSYRFFTPPGFIGNRSTGSFFKRFSIRLRQFPLTTDLIQHTTYPNSNRVPQVKVQFVTSQTMTYQ